jgi:methylmalonyl-CoA/ethylmalonyl-CoA epimerase
MEIQARLSHIAIACPEIAAAAAKLKVLALSVAEVHEVPTERVKAAMLPLEVSAHLRLELLEPTAKDSPIAKFLEKKPAGGIHHLCFEVTHLDSWLPVLSKAGLEVLPPGIRPAARGRALFIHPKSMAGILVELEEISLPGTQA